MKDWLRELESPAPPEVLAYNEIMRKNNNKEIVKTITTGHIEGDMLGQVIFWLSERKNRRIPQRPHRTYQRTRKLNISESYIRVWFRAAIEWSQTAPTACLRSIKGYLRRGKRNGK